VPAGGGLGIVGTPLLEGVGFSTPELPGNGRLGIVGMVGSGVVGPGVVGSGVVGSGVVGSGVVGSVSESSGGWELAVLSGF